MYKILPHTSDLEVLVEADSFEELIRESVLAITKAVVEKVESNDKRQFTVEGSYEEKLMKVLEEVVYLQSTELFYVKDVLVKDNKIELIGGKAEARDEIKAVTWHDFWVKGTKAHFICDL